MDRRDRLGDDPELADDWDDDADGSTAAGLPPVISDRRLGLWLVVGGAIAFVAALTLTIERFELALDPSYVPSCSINPVLSCGNVMATPQAALFGFPNPIIGVGAFAALVMLGVLLLTGARLVRWVRVGLLVGVSLGMAMIGWLISQSLFAIHALCPYCMVVWAVMIPLFWTVLASTLERGAIPAPRGVVTALVDLRVPLIILSYALVVALVGVEFWSYWRTLLP